MKKGMSPDEYLISMKCMFINAYENLKLKHASYEPSKYTEKEYQMGILKDRLQQLNLFINIVDKAEYEIICETIEGTREPLDLPCTKTIIADTIVFKVPTGISQSGLQEIEDQLRILTDKGAFANKSIVVIPYDITIMKAKIK